MAVSPKKANYERVTITLPPEMLNVLKGISEKEYRSISEIIRDSLRDYLSSKSEIQDIRGQVEKLEAIVELEKPPSSLPNSSIGDSDITFSKTQNLGV